MDPFAVFLGVCGASAFLALVLSITRFNVVTRRVALLALCLALAMVPIALVIDLGETWQHLEPNATRVAQVGRALNHALSYAGLAAPCALMAGLALRRASARQRR